MIKKSYVLMGLGMIIISIICLIFILVNNNTKTALNSTDRIFLPQIPAHLNQMIDQTPAQLSLIINSTHKLKSKKSLFTITNLNNNVYSDSFLLNHTNITADLINYCSSHVLKNQTSQLNCNAALRVDNSWYKLYMKSDMLIKYAVNSSSPAISIIIFTLGLFSLYYMIICLNSVIHLGLFSIKSLRHNANQYSGASAQSSFRKPLNTAQVEL